MVKAIERLRKSQRENAFLLRARLVDRQGALLRPGALRSLTFAIITVGCADDVEWPVAITALDPTEVVLCGLQKDEDWSIDACGYNFCHCIDGNWIDLVSLPARFEFRYIFQDTSGGMSIVRFQIKGLKHD